MKRAHLQLTPLEEARRRFFDALEKAGFFVASEEEIETPQALWRVTSREVLARRAVPHFASAAMDGIAVRAAQTQQASLQRPLRLVRGRDFEFIDTGQPIPPPFDAVIKIEDVQEFDSQTVVITRPTSAGKHVRAVGEDFALGAQVVPAGFQLTPEAIAALLSAGHLSVWVKRQLKAIFIPTGSELVSWRAEPQIGQFCETNSQIVAGLLEEWGALVTVHEIVPNEAERIRAALHQALGSYDLVLVGSGTSQGRGDLVPQIVQELGKVLVHGVAYHPGHPVLLGLGRGAIVGLPGYPVAAWLALHLFVKPVLERYYFGRERERFKLRAKLAQPVKSARGYREFVRARLERAADGSYWVYPLQGGASKLSTIVNADGWIEVPEEIEAYEQNTFVEVTLVRGRP
ncbi:MAG: molybdopterin-binding protein [Candidatus Bipolaricaulota bacterium]|nr:molybdopterin-binding protein [Candidatus Bipolaricaulota bacterium]MCS7274424.1 molybdopterin-binding protein [Candidatus Bipolaricaulota bacterium]MDW8110853.1 molybdopterin-binding protein [Candidatus Bipolaricaulota bacterium]MDW8328666.1 molybdopterin-binding protein [Candidatus Bipolaricaulota bacterium]